MGVFLRLPIYVIVFIVFYYLYQASFLSNASSFDYSSHFLLFSVSI